MINGEVSKETVLKIIIGYNRSRAVQMTEATAKALAAGKGDEIVGGPC